MTDEERMKLAKRIAKHAAPVLSGTNKKALHKVFKAMREKIAENPMIITRDAVIQYWLTEPERHYYEPGRVIIPQVPFPDLATLSPEEKNALRPVLMAHPEYLSEFWGEGIVQ